MRNFFGHLHSFSKLGVVALVCFISLIFLLIVASVVAIPIYGPESFSQLMGVSTDLSEDNISFLKFIQTVQSLGLFVIPSLVLAYLFSNSTSDYFKLKQKPYWSSILLAVSIILVSNPLINFTSELNSLLTLPSFLSGVENWMRQTEDSAAMLTQMFLKVESVGGLMFNILMIGLIPAIGEEFLFRGVIQRTFFEWTKSQHWAVWLSALLFSALHFQFYGFIPRAILGAMFGYLFVISGNLWLPVIAHFFNNTAAVIAYFLYGNGVMQVDPDSIGANTQNPVAALLSVVLLVVLFRWFKKKENKRNQKLIVD